MDTVEWLSHLLPCPKELSVDDSIEIERAHLAIEIAGAVNPAVEQAAAELRDLLPSQGETGRRDPSFTVTLGIPDAQGRLGSTSIDVDFPAHVPTRSRPI